MKKAILLAAVMLAAACIVRDKPTQSKFIAISGERQLDRIKFLVKDIFKPQWKIGYRYGIECKPEERQNGEGLKEAMSIALRTWLKPLKELQPSRSIVDKFIYVLQADFNPINPEDSYNLNEPEDLGGWREVDLRVTFQCRQGISIAAIGIKFQPGVFMRLGTKLTPWMRSAITHEFGHAFGLHDTYARDSRRNGGGLNSTADTQPASVMAMAGEVHADKIGDSPHAIAEDDARGIVWLYKHFYENQAEDNCFFADYVYVGGICTPKYPLIFETKYNQPGFAVQIMKDDPSIDINAQDASGMTALHYAVMYNKVEVVKALLADKDIKPLLRNKDGDTPYDIALAAGHEEFIKMLPAPVRRKEDVNGDGVINILDLVAVAGKFGQKNAGNADVNSDGKVDILDLVLVASAFGTTNTVASAPDSAPALHPQANLTATTVASWLTAAQKLTPQAHYARGLIQLQRLHAQLSTATTELLTNFGCARVCSSARTQQASLPVLSPQTNFGCARVCSSARTQQASLPVLSPQTNFGCARVCSSARTQQASLPVLSPQTNFPNPFRSETWFPYRLNKAAQVSIHIYSQQGQLVRTLALGHKPAGVYQDKSSAGYWDGRNMQGEPVASGVYFYTLSTGLAGDFTATRKMVLRR